MLPQLAGYIIFGVSVVLGAVTIAHWSYLRIAERRGKRRGRRW